MLPTPYAFGGIRPDIGDHGIPTVATAAAAEWLLSPMRPVPCGFFAPTDWRNHAKVAAACAANEARCLDTIRANAETARGLSGKNAAIWADTIPYWLAWAEWWQAVRLDVTADADMQVAA